MTDTFSFHPPSLDHYHPHLESTIYARQRPSSSSGYGQHTPPPPPASYQHHSASAIAGRPSYDTAIQHQQQAHPSDMSGDHSAGSDSDDNPLIGLPSTTAIEGAAIAAQLREGKGVSFEGPIAGASSSMASYTPAPHSFPSQYHVGAGVNMHNTRPMTAPSSVSAPYFHGGSYTPAAFFPPSHFEPNSSRPFQYQVDGGHHEEEVDAYRGRQFSLPELNGLPGGDYTHGDDSRAAGASPGSSTFYYRPPSDSTVNSSYYRPTTASSPEQADQYSRPTTADSRTTSSSRTVRHPGQAPANRNGAIAAYQSLANPAPYATPADDERPSHYGEAKVYNFIAQAGQTTKRPRRRYDEIERLYTCDYPGCQKAYGTLNHLNSHKTMQKHGPKSTPAQFKELRKAWRENKKAAQAAAAARAQENEAKGLIAAGKNKGPIRPIAERPRPSTSAGEYHYNVPAPFMSSLGAPIGGAPYGHVQLPLPNATGTGPFDYPLPPHPAQPQSHQAAPWPPAGYQSTHSPYDSPYNPSSPHRPLTAPSFYSGVPTFGLHHPTPLLPNGLASGNSFQRRSSLPGAPASFGYEKSFPSIQEEGGYSSGDLVEEERA